MNDSVRLTQTEARAYAMEKREKKCNACTNVAFVLWGKSVCGIGKKWPKHGVCKTFSDHRGKREDRANSGDSCAINPDGAQPDPWRRR